MITYQTMSNGGIAVYLDGRRVGTIVDLKPGFQYRPKGPSGGGDFWGDTFPTLEACKRSLL